MTWRETFFEPWLKKFDLFLKTAFCMSRGTFLVKKTFFESSVFFQTLRNLDRTFTVLGEKLFGRDIKNENCTLCLQNIMLRRKIIFWKFCMFSFVSDLEHEIFGFVATEFSRVLSKLHSTFLFEFFLRCWYKKWIIYKRNFFWNLAESFWPVC